MSGYKGTPRHKKGGRGRLGHTTTEEVLRSIGIVVVFLILVIVVLTITIFMIIIIVVIIVTHLLPA